MATGLSFEIVDDYSVKVTDTRFGASEETSLPRCMTVTMDIRTKNIRIIAPNLVNSGTSAALMQFNVADILSTSLDANGDIINNTDPVRACNGLRTIFKGFNSSTSGGGGGSGTAWGLGGNTNSQDEDFGTKNTHNVNIITKGTFRGRFYGAQGEFLWGDTNLGAFSVAAPSSPHRKVFFNNASIFGNNVIINNTELNADDTGIQCMEAGISQARFGYWGGYAQAIADAKDFYIGTNGATARIRFVAGGGTTKMTIRETGNVGIGTTTPTAKLSVNGSINCIGAVGAFSDARLKTDKSSLALDWDSLIELGAIAKSFKYIPELAGTDEAAKTRYGFIADEVADAGFNDFVTESSLTYGDTYEVQNGHEVQTSAGTTIADVKILEINHWLIPQLLKAVVELHEQVRLLQGV